MCFSGQVVLFVEGSWQPGNRGEDPLAEIWQGLLADSLHLLPFARIRPISKKNLVAMDHGTKRSGVGVIPLDELILFELNGDGIDVAVVALDLVPSWNPDAACCRREEVLELYRLLASSACLPNLWRQQAEVRFQQLQQQAKPTSAPTGSTLRTGEVFAVCMEKIFESLFDAHEDMIRRALGVTRKRVPGWPRWQQGFDRPDTQLLQPALLAGRDCRPRPAIYRRIRGDMRTNKNGWGAHFLRTILDHDEPGATLHQHPLVQRLVALLHRDRQRCRR